MEETITLMCDSITREMLWPEEVDYRNYAEGRYFRLYTIKGNDPDYRLPNNYIFSEVWATNTGTPIRIEYGDPGLTPTTIYKVRQDAAIEHGCKLLFLIEVRVPYYFFKLYYDDRREPRCS